jgi:adenylylsulfate kinase
MKLVMWFTGLSGSGKTSLGKKLFTYLKANNHSVIFLDGDDLRSGLCKDLGFTKNDRTENIRRVAELACLLLKQVDIVIVATISPEEKQRNLAKNIIGDKYFRLIYLSTPLEVCKHRDPKGHYLKANQGLIKKFTGVSAPFDTPKYYNLEINTNNFSLDASLKKILTYFAL